MKNKLSDLNNHLFAQIERLGDEDLSGDQLKAEISRSNALTSVSSQIVENARLSLQAKKLMLEHGAGDADLPPMLEAGNK